MASFSPQNEGFERKEFLSPPMENLPQAIPKNLARQKYPLVEYNFVFLFSEIASPFSEAQLLLSL